MADAGEDQSDSRSTKYYVCALASDSSCEYRLDAEGTTVFGRRTDSDVVISDPGCSRMHATLTVVDGRAKLKNFGSQVGTTLVWNTPLPQGHGCDIANGDVFEICGRRFRFEVVCGKGDAASDARPTASRAAPREKKRPASTAEGEAPARAAAQPKKKAKKAASVAKPAAPPAKKRSARGQNDIQLPRAAKKAKPGPRDPKHGRDGEDPKPRRGSKKRRE